MEKKKIIKTGIILGCVLALLLGVSYAFLSFYLRGDKSHAIKVGNLELILDEDENNLNITGAMPIADEVGMLQDPFTFRVINNTTMETGYKIKLADITTGDKLSPTIVKYGLIKNDNAAKIAMLSTLEDGVIDYGILKGGKTREYELRLWLDENVEDEELFTGKSLSYRVEVEATQVLDNNDIVINWKYVGSSTAPKTFPGKNEGYHVSEVSCNQDVVEWDDYNWQIEVDFTGEYIECMLSIDDGDNNPMTEEIETLEEEIRYCENEREDETTGKASIVEAVNSAYPSTSTARLTTDSSWDDIYDFVTNKMYLYQATQSGTTSGYILDGSSSGDNLSTTDTVTFKTAFSSKPTVVASASGAQHAQCTVSVSNITTTGFTFTVRNTAAGRGTCTVSWFAY